MTIVRIKKHEKPYVMLDKGFLKNTELSLKGKGLLAVLLSLPPDWKINIRGLTRLLKEKKQAISNTLEELKKAGYAHYQQSRNDHGLFNPGIWTVFELPEPQVTELKPEFIPEPRNWDARQPDPSFRDPVHPDPAKPEPGDQSLLINRYTNERNNKEIAAAANDKQGPNYQIVAAENIIGARLTEKQKQRVLVAVKELQRFAVPYSEQALLLGIEFTLLDPKSFIKTESIFLKKLNAILKTIREGGWSPPAPPSLEKDRKYIELIYQLKEAYSAVEHWHKMADYKKGPLNEIERAYLERCGTELVNKRAELDIYRSAYELEYQEYMTHTDLRDDVMKTSGKTETLLTHTLI